MLSELFCRGDEMAEKRLLLCCRVGYGGDVLARYDEYVGRVLWMEVAECDALVVLIDEWGWDFLCDDFTEDAVGGHRLYIHLMFLDVHRVMNWVVHVFCFENGSIYAPIPKQNACVRRFLLFFP